MSLPQSNRQNQPRGLRSDDLALARKHSRPCPACGRDTDQDFRFKKNGSEIYQCASCGLGRAEATDFDPSSYYTAEYFEGGHADGYPDYLGAETVLRHEFAKTVGFIRRFKSSGRLLELGCAYGFFLKEANRYFTTAGLELAASAAEHCRRAGLNVSQGCIDRSALEKAGCQDVIVMLDVIEHVPEPFDVLQLCADHLNPGGVIVLTTGDFGSAAARVAGKAWRLMTPPQHLWYFTTESMRRLSARIGMQVACLDHPWKLVPASLILFQLRRMAGLSGSRSSGGSSFGVPVNLFDAMRVVLRKP